MDAKDLQDKDSFSVWRGMLYGSKALTHGIRWRIGSKDDILFWIDNWLSCDNGVWDITCLLPCLPNNIVKLINGIYASFNGSGVDKWIWLYKSYYGITSLCKVNADGSGINVTGLSGAAASDALATRSYNLGLGLYVYEESPNFLKDVLVTDVMGVVRSRSVGL
ncbi:hypothetical protein SADUNF_Sadunf18G0072500 [Salix dunnii]|uniref:Uncharacterized protein n=1 Tax=Salix dunnii TaxID=1413687 RepID=A0A835J4V0_9ROSI|nr:hypothetical protein SADUNF_Sadunf18G0072500 [Salix dunnii]